jgi:hypothetical protein
LGSVVIAAATISVIAVHAGIQDSQPRVDPGVRP